MKWEDAIRLNPKEHQAFAWATEDEVRSGKYQMFENHKKTVLEAFCDRDSEMFASSAGGWVLDKELLREQNLGLFSSLNT